MSIVRFLFTSLAGVGSLLGFAIAIAATIALGPFFWVPYALLYLLLRGSGLTPKQLRTPARAKPQATNDEPVFVGEDIALLYAPLPVPVRTAHAPWLADLPTVTPSIFDVPPSGPSSLD